MSDEKRATYAPDNRSGSQPVEKKKKPKNKTPAKSASSGTDEE